jgi:hypothetical protein
MASFNKFQPFVENLAEKVHNLGSDALKWLLTNTAPAAANAVKADLTEIAAANGYSAGGVAPRSPRARRRRARTSSCSRTRRSHGGRRDRTVPLRSALQRHADVAGRSARRLLRLRLEHHARRHRVLRVRRRSDERRSPSSPNRDPHGIDVKVTRKKASLTRRAPRSRDDKFPQLRKAMAICRPRSEKILGKSGPLREQARQADREDSAARRGDARAVAADRGARGQSRVRDRQPDRGIRSRTMGARSMSQPTES